MTVAFSVAMEREEGEGADKTGGTEREMWESDKCVCAGSVNVQKQNKLYQFIFFYHFYF